MSYRSSSRPRLLFPIIDSAEFFAVGLIKSRRRAPPAGPERRVRPKKTALVPHYCGTRAARGHGRGRPRFEPRHRAPWVRRSNRKARRLFQGSATPSGAAPAHRFHRAIALRILSKPPRATWEEARRRRRESARSAPKCDPRVEGREGRVFLNRSAHSGTSLRGDRALPRCRCPHPCRRR